MAQDLKRKLVIEGLLKVENSGFSNLVFSALMRERDSLLPKERAFAAKVFYGTIERKITLNYILQQFIKKPLSKLDEEVLAILQSGLYQILYMNSVPTFAAINQAVSLCSVFKKTSAKGLVNAVLRKSANFDMKNAVFNSEKERICITYSISEQIAEIIMADYPDEYEEIFKAMFNPPILNININTTKIPSREFRNLLDDAGVKYKNTVFENCVELQSHGDITKFPGFADGYFFVQGITSRYAVSTAEIKKNDRVLDLCAAPGGKSFAAGIYLNNTGSIISCDPNPSRHALINGGAKRLGFENIITVENYGEKYRECLIGQNVVICDVPCSGIGIIPKKPDLRYKKLDDVNELYKLQHDILKTAAKYVKTGGRLIYSTCTINKAENQQQIEKFLAENEDFRLLPQDCPIEGAVNDNNMVTFLPHKAKSDGFFVAVLEKVW